VVAPESLKQQLVDEAAALGFDLCRIVNAQGDKAAADGLAAFVEAGHHGQMQWMENRMAQRAAPQSLWPAAQSVIMLGVNYGPDKDPLAALAETDKGVISVYAQRRDYHDVIKKKLKSLARWLVAQSGAQVKVFVDTAPVMEKPWSGKYQDTPCTLRNDRFPPHHQAIANR